MKRLIILLTVCGLTFFIPLKSWADPSPLLSAVPIFGPLFDAFYYEDEGPSGYVPSQTPNTDMLQASNYAADVLNKNLVNRMDVQSVIIVSVFTELGAMDKSSPFGRLAANQIASRLSQHGYLVMESRLRKDMAFRAGQGEFMMTRNPDKLAISNFEVQAVLTGTYQLAGNVIFVSTRVIRLADQVILASCDYTIPVNDRQIRALLRNKYDYQDIYGRRQAFASPGRIEPIISQPKSRPASSRPARRQSSHKSRGTEPRQEDRPANLPSFNSAFSPVQESNSLK